MPKKNSSDIYKKKKRRALGLLDRDVELKSGNAWIAIHKSSKDQLLTYESEGLVVSINGSGSLDENHTQVQQSAQLAESVASQDGIIINGGRASGIMAAASKAAGDNGLGIIFPEIEKEQNTYGKKVKVNNPHPRIELLATCAPIVVIFRGGLGTLMVLMRAIVHMSNQQYHPEESEQMVFVSNYWIGLLSTMMNLGALPKEFIQRLHFFDTVQQVIDAMPTTIKKK